MPLYALKGVKSIVASLHLRGAKCTRNGPISGVIPGALGDYPMWHFGCQIRDIPVI